MSSSICTYSEIDLLPIVLGQAASTELQAHVTDCPSCQQRLQQLESEASTLRQALAVGGSTITYAPTETAAPTDRALAIIGKYLIVGKIGQGAQATAYRALHPVLHKELVIKYAKRPIGASLEERNALIREGRILADLDHPHLAKILDLDFHDDRPFLVMEYHRGVNLEQFASQRRLPAREAATLIAPLARALGAAHRRGVVHQDMKPANILIDEDAKPFVLDFGLARLRDAWSAGADQPEGGTASYMSPEQARADTGKIGPASDVFSLGAVLYFLLTGHPPFQAGDWYDTMKQAGRCEFDRDALRERGTPPRLAAICLRAMAAEPERRYHRAEDFAADLECYLRRPRWPILLAAAASILLVAIAIWQFWPKSYVEAVAVAKAPMLQPLIQTMGRPDHGKTQRRKFVPGMGLKAGDILSLGYSVPPGYQSALFLMTPQGEVRQLGPLRTNRVGDLDEIRFPPEGEDWRVEGPAGPLFFLACANRQAAPTLAEVRLLIQENGDKALPLPAPPEDYLFYLTREKIHEEVQPRGVVDDYAKLFGRLERLRGNAAGKFDYVWGVVVAVR